ncbi:UNVERIFIED_CONTAM: hypothetical protein FKN15_041251 [Acipenser sinensis]
MQSGELVRGLLLALLWGGHCWGLTEEEKSSIVLLHNALRSQVSPSATDMQLMVSMHMSERFTDHSDAPITRISLKGKGLRSLKGGSVCAAECSVPQLCRS